MNMRVTSLLVFYQICMTLSSGLARRGGTISGGVCFYQQTYDLIESIINWHNLNTNFWFVVVSDGKPAPLSDHSMEHKILTNAAPKIVFNQNVVNFPATRNFAAILFTDRLNMSLKLPPDVIKIYLDHSGCQLNETNLALAMNALWLSNEIGFIYYIAFCRLNTTNNYDSIDNTQQIDNCNCTINLFYHQPFVKNKSGQWGVMEKVNLINDGGGEERQWINMSSQVFHDFPFHRKHNLKLNQLNMTVILFTSTASYHRSELGIFRNQLSSALLDDPWHHIDAYFGEDSELLRELVLQMNFTLTLSPTTDRQLFGFKQPDGSFVGALGDIINKRADFIINGCFVKDYLTDLLEFTSSIDDDKLCIVTKTAALVPDSLLIFRLFTVTVWIAIVITLIGVVLAYALLLTMIDDFDIGNEGTHSPGKFRDKSFCKKFYLTLMRGKNIAFRIIGLLLGAPGTTISTTNSVHERLFVAICLLWSIIICGAFQGSLYHVYSTPKSYPNIDTLDDLYKSRLDIHVRHPGLITDIFGDAPPGTTLGDLRTRRLKPTDDDRLNERIVSRGDVAGLARYANYDYDSSNLEPRENGKSNLHIVSECPRSYTLAYLFRKRSIYIDTVNWNINMFMQSGLTVKWRKETKFYFKLDAALRHRKGNSNGRVKINLGHLEMAFLGLLTGHVLGTLVFLLERCQNKK